MATPASLHGPRREIDSHILVTFTSRVVMGPASEPTSVLMQQIIGLDPSLLEQQSTSRPHGRPVNWLVDQLVHLS